MNWLYSGLFDGAQIAALHAATGVLPLANEIEFHPWSSPAAFETVKWCREHGVGILAHSVLGKGLCTGKHPADKVWPEDDERGTDAYNQDFMGERWSGPSQTGQLD